MTSPRFDVIVAGLGAMGSAVAFHLARRGQRVLGLDRYDPPHTLGSSHGKSRIIREAYFEDPRYVPLVARAYEQWDTLQRLSGERILERTGGLMVGPPDGRVAAGALASAQRHHLPHETLTASEITRRFPGLRPTTDMVGVLEPRAGYVVPETAIRAHLTLAAAAGAVIRTNEPLVEWTSNGDGVRITTAQDTYEADRLVLSVGAWLRQLAPGLHLPLIVERNVVHWFQPAHHTTLFAPERFPVIICEYAPDHAWYSFPDYGEGVKIGLHHVRDGAATTDPDRVERTVAPEEIAYIRALLRTFMPAADGPLIASSVCLYTNTPDEHFVIDTHPAHPHVELVSPCSGHGFKFASVIGELVADRITTGTTRFDLTPFRLRW